MTSCDNSLGAPALSNALCITIQIQLQHHTCSTIITTMYTTGNKPGSEVKASFLQNFAT